MARAPRSRLVTPVRRTIAGYPATLTDVIVAGETVALYGVPDLERRVDRAAVLRGDEEPPYWAYTWAGARVLADYVARWLDVGRCRVVDLGCGLGLSGLAAARRGAHVLFVDQVRAAVAFALASARANGCRAAGLCADFTSLDPQLHADLILAAEIIYEQGRFGALADVLAHHVRAGGIALAADGHRSDTRDFYGKLTARRLAVHAIEVHVREEEQPLVVRLNLIQRR